MHERFVYHSALNNEASSLFAVSHPSSLALFIFVSCTFDPLLLNVAALTVDVLNPTPYSTPASSAHRFRPLGAYHHCLHQNPSGELAPLSHSRLQEPLGHFGRGGGSAMLQFTVAAA